MGLLSLIGTVDQSIQFPDAHVSDLQTVTTANGTFLLVTSGENGGMASYRVNSDATVSLIETELFSPYASSGALDALTLLTVSSSTYVLFAGYPGGLLIAKELLADGTFAPSTLNILAQGSISTGVLSFVPLEGVENALLYMAGDNASGLETFEFDPAMQFVSRSYLADTDDLYAAEITAMETVSVGSSTFLITASAEGGISSFRVDETAGGVPVAAASVGMNHGLGLNTPTAMTQMEISGSSFIAVLDAGSNALAMFRINESGALELADFILDTRQTRFADASAMASFTANGSTFIIAGGGDDGLSLFTVLGDGQLVHLETIEDDLITGLQNVSAISATVLTANIQIAISSQAEDLLTLYAIPLAELGDVITGTSADDLLTGTHRNDTLTGGSGADQILAGTGDDVMRDGFGADHLWGGSGSDIFVMTQDGTSDWIEDFDPGTDRLDLSGFNGFYSTNQLSLTQTANGAEIELYGEILHLISSTGLPLSLSDIFPTGIPGPDRPPQSFTTELFGTDVADNLFGTNGDDVINAYVGNDVVNAGEGEDTIFGHGGFDLLSGKGGNDIIDGGAGHDDIYGGTGDDVLYGGTGDDLIGGGSGDDLIYGHAGSDALWGAAGNDEIHGGAGNDEIGGGNGIDHLVGGGNDDLIWTGAGDDNAWGGSGSDDIGGGDGNDTLYGGDGDDFVWGAADNDILHGEDGNDTIGAGPGTDTIHAGAGNDIIWAGPDDDWIDAGDGDDLITAGAGDDLIIGGAGADIFEFAEPFGTDTINDFDVAADRLRFSETLWPGTLTTEQLVDLYGGYDRGSAMLDFGTNGRLILDSFVDLAALPDAIEFI